MMLNFYVKTRIRFSLRDKRLFEITEVEITRVDCIYLPEPMDSLDLIRLDIFYCTPRTQIITTLASPLPTNYKHFAMVHIQQLYIHTFNPHISYGIERNVILF